MPGGRQADRCDAGGPRRGPQTIAGRDCSRGDPCTPALQSIFTVTCALLAKKGNFWIPMSLLMTRAPGSISLGVRDIGTDTIHARRTRAFFLRLPARAMLPQP